MEKLKLISHAIRAGGVLANIVAVEGSAYRKTGTMMLFTKEGQQIGMISASCLEADLAIQAEELQRSLHRFSEIVVYDMSREDDLGWGRGAGCNGKVHVLLEKVDEQLKESLRRLKVYLEKHIPVTMYRRLQSVPHQIATSYHPRGCPSFGVDISPYSKEEWNVQHFHPQQRLIIFGAGPDALPLIRSAKSVGFETYVWDWRPDLLNPKRLLYARCLWNFETMDYKASDYVVVMTHDFQHDQQIIRKLLLKQAFRYVGVLGPRKRLKRLLNSNEIPPWINSPIGLNIKAEGPEEIAISMMAEMIKVKNEVQLREQESHRDLFSGGKKYKI